MLIIKNICGQHGLYSVYLSGRNSWLLEFSATITATANTSSTVLYSDGYMTCQLAIDVLLALADTIRLTSFNSSWRLKFAF